MFSEFFGGSSKMNRQAILEIDAGTRAPAAPRDLSFQPLYVCASFIAPLHQTPKLQVEYLTTCFARAEQNLRADHLSHPNFNHVL